MKSTVREAPWFSLGRSREQNKRPSQLFETLNLVSSIHDRLKTLDTPKIQ